MTNIDTQIIFDKNGNPIPQYLDVTDKTGGSAGTMKPITGQNGAQFTQLTGSNVEKVAIFNALAIADTNEHLKRIDVKKYKRLILLATNNLNVPVTLTIRLDSTSTSRVWNGEQWVAPSASIPSTSFQNRYLVNSILPFIDTIISEDIWISAQAHTLPDSGAFSLYLFGEVR